MTPELLIAILSLIGTCLGSLGGILTANRLTNFRISELEKRVEKHNQLVERTFRLESAVEELQHEKANRDALWGSF